MTNDICIGRCYEMYETLTKYLPELTKTKYGSWVLDTTNDGSLAHPKHFPFIDYDTTVDEIRNAIYAFEKSHPEYQLTKYNDILAKNHMDRGMQSIKTVDVQDLDGQTVMAMLMAATRIERFCTGAMLDFFESGNIRQWIQRLKDIDDANQE